MLSSSSLIYSLLHLRSHTTEKKGREEERRKERRSCKKLLKKKKKKTKKKKRKRKRGKTDPKIKEGRALMSTLRFAQLL